MINGIFMFHAQEVIRVTQNVFRFRDTSEYYVGYKVVNFKLVRLDGVIQTWAPWKSGEPTGTGDCVSSFNIDGTFWDEKCTTPYQALCQYPGFSRKFKFIFNLVYAMCVK